MQVNEIIKCSGTATAYTVKARELSEHALSADSKYFVAFEYKKKRSRYHKRKQYEADTIQKQMLYIHFSVIFLFAVFA